MTRGNAGTGPIPDERARPTLLLTVRPLPPTLPTLLARGVAVVLLPFARDAGPGWGALKLVGHASAIVGKRLAARRHAFEGLYVTPQALVTEGTTSNVFIVERGTLLTPPADGSILRGVTRDLVLAIARRTGLRPRETSLDADRVRRADEVFLTASTIEVLPVTRVDGRRIGAGRPGPMTRVLQDGYRAAVARTLGRPRRLS